MKTIIGYILLVVAILNVLGFLYLTTTNPDKLSNNSEYFVRKILFAMGMGGVGLWLILSTKKEKDNA
jgi:hypothetical protein